METDGYSALESITVQAYWLNCDKPVCALDFKTGKACKFYRSIGIRGIELCIYTGDWLNREDTVHGYLVPCVKCPIHNKED